MQRIARLGTFLVVLAVLVVAAAAQIGRRFPEPIPPHPRIPSAMEAARLKHLNKERYEKLKADTDKLLELATNLKQEVDRADENTLSLDVIRTADDIDKLAKSVRDKMKEDIGPAFH